MATTFTQGNFRFEIIEEKEKTVKVNNDKHDLQIQ